MGMVLRYVDLNGNDDDVVVAVAVEDASSGNGNGSCRGGGEDGGGGVDSGKGSILKDVDSPVVGVERLYKFANAGNQQALYM